MFNKFKIYNIKKSLSIVEQKIFSSLCIHEKENTLDENKELALMYAKSQTVKEHHIGEIYKIKALRYALLNQNERDMFLDGIQILNKFSDLKIDIESKGYKIFCNPQSYEKLLFESDNISKVEKTLNLFKKELSLLEQSIAKKDLEADKTKNANINKVFLSDLNANQKDSLYFLGYDLTDNPEITLLKLKELYNTKLRSLNYKTSNVTDDYIKKLSKAFFNVKKVFDNPI